MIITVTNRMIDDLISNLTRKNIRTYPAEKETSSFTRNYLVMKHPIFYTSLYTLLKVFCFICYCSAATEATRLIIESVLVTNC